MVMYIVDPVDILGTYDLVGFVLSKKFGDSSLLAFVFTDPLTVNMKHPIIRRGTSTVINQKRWLI